MPAQPDTIIDADVHPLIDGNAVRERLSQPWRTRWDAGKRAPGRINYWNPNPIYRPDAVTPDEQRIERDPKLLAEHYLDANAIEFAVLNPGSTLGWCLDPDVDYACPVLSAMNDIMLEDWAAADERFRVSITVSPQDVPRAVEEIHRAAGQPGVAQVYMSSGARMPYGQRYHWPIYEAACEHDLPVAIHPGTEGVGVSYPATPAGHPSRYFEWHTSLVCNYIGHLVSLVSEGVFQQFPTLKFVFIEGGMAWLPPVMWRFDKNWKSLRSTTPWLDRLPSEVIADHIRVTTQPIEEAPQREQFEQIMGMFPVQRMAMFSSDYPHWDGDTPQFTARHFAYDQTVQKQVMSETARELYKLPVRAMKLA